MLIYMEGYLISCVISCIEKIKFLISCVIRCIEKIGFLISCVISCVGKRPFLNYNSLYTGLNFGSVAVAVSKNLSS